MSNVHCIVFAEREVKQMHTNFLIHSACLYVCVCAFIPVSAHVDDCAATHIHKAHVLQ